MTQHELRDRIGLVPQKGNLFSGTIRSNLKYGAPEATDEELEEVIRIAQAKEFIDQKKNVLIWKFHKVEQTFLVVKNKDLRLLVLLRKIQIFIFLMIVFQHLISKQMLNFVKN